MAFPLGGDSPKKKGGRGSESRAKRRGGGKNSVSIKDTTTKSETSQKK